MADDKQLTVAELLAQSGGASKRGSKPRRRRRSIDDGGISVAELTGSIRRVDAKPEQSKHSSIDIDEPAPVVPAPKQSAKAPEAKKAEEKKPEPKLEAKKPEAKKTEPKAEPKLEAKEPSTGAAVAGGAAAGAADRPSQQDEEDTSVIKKVTEKQASKSPVKDDDTGIIAPVTSGSQDAQTRDSELVSRNAELDEAAADEDHADDYVDDTGDDSGKINVVAVILLAIVGIVLGAVVFKGFELLWSRMDFGIVVALAVAVTAIMVGVVHALRTERDVFSMALAGVVGLVLTFGPLIIVM